MSIQIILIYKYRCFICFTYTFIKGTIEKGDNMKEKAKYIIVEDYIKNQISEGKLKPGDQLGTEVQLAEQCQVLIYLH